MEQIKEISTLEDLGDYILSFGDDYPEDVIAEICNRNGWCCYGEFPFDEYMDDEDIAFDPSTGELLFFTVSGCAVIRRSAEDWDIERAQRLIRKAINRHYAAYGVENGVASVDYDGNGGFHSIRPGNIEGWKKYFSAHPDEFEWSFASTDSADTYDLADEEQAKDFADRVGRSIHGKAVEIARQYDRLPCFLPVDFEE